MSFRNLGLKFVWPTKTILYERAHKGFHTFYFAAVAVEGHGYYAIAGGSLFLLAVLDFFLHFEG